MLDMCTIDMYMIDMYIHIYVYIYVWRYISVLRVCSTYD